jgi:hypothetical protein
VKDIAHISFAGGGFITPAQTPYERQLLVEHIEVSTKRHGCIHLEFNRRHWTIRMNKGPGAVCASCSQWPTTLTFPVGASGRLAVISTRAPRCTDGMCALAPALR